MADGSVAFDAVAVRASLRGAKVQYRQPVLWRECAGFVEPDDHPGAPAYEYHYGLAVTHKHPDGGCCSMPIRRVPAFQGCALWVREPWAVVPELAGCEKVVSAFDPGNRGVRYRATWDKAHAAGWRSSVSMPRAASRLRLRVAAARVERLQAITDEGAIAEGVAPLPLQEGMAGCWWTGDPSLGSKGHARTPREAYAKLWKRRHGRLSWDRNPWVWVVTYAIERDS